ncbi:PAS-domain containing protein [Limobrevibacterium gyesilva]|uniref:histidine kinase n=1 Tax=Limobrevibacterium gyesilva TaxID=2991712 RepID=A0AA41YJA5_9PROT|nr:PAS-domain containing protein [Limobrevibacterium gyesilva]MCW3473276.1 PAS-domain containing protein [Limobrevibacterium gyesilva]
MGLLAIWSVVVAVTMSQSKPDWDRIMRSAHEPTEERVGDIRCAQVQLSDPAAAPTRGFRLAWQGAIVAAACMLVALAWIGAYGTLRVQHAETLARVEGEVGNKALILEEQLRRQLLTIDQTLRILEAAWQNDPGHFDLSAWSRQLVMLTDASLQVFVADKRGIVWASTRPEIIGNDVSGRDYFRHEAALPTDDGKMFISTLVQGLTTRQWQLNLVRRLDRDGDVFAGVVSASYDTAALAQFYGKVEVGARGLIGVVSTSDGGLRTLVGPVPAEPNANIAGTPLFAALQASPNGQWLGPSAPDGIERIHAFRSVPDRELAVLVGVDRDEALHALMIWERGAVVFAACITVLALLMTWLLLREGRSARRREKALAHDSAVLAEANARAQAKAAQLEATLSGMTDGVMMVDADLQLVAWNQHFPEFTGVPPEMLQVGLPMEVILRAQAMAGEFGEVDIEAEVTRRMARLRTGGSTGTIERTRPGGRVLELRRNPVGDGGFVTLYTDITTRRQTEDRLRQAQTMASIGRLTSGVAHDFNNLLASITGNAEMLDRDLHDDPVHARRITIILQAAERGAALVRQLLAFARKQALAPTRVDLNGVVRNMSELLRSMLGPTIRIETHLGAELWPALADPIQIEHVILNLAINARDAMPDGGQLAIATTNEDLGPAGATPDLPVGSYVVVSVADTGTGMTEEVLSNVFEPFFTTKPPGKGSGLGLSQVYGVATQSGGGVRIDSNIGVGTTVKVYFPRAIAGSGVVPDAVINPPGGTAGRPAQDAPGPGGCKVLLVEDDPSVRETVAAMLSASGYTTIEMEGGREAVQLLENGLRVDLLLVDFAMPDMNGAEVARIARRSQPSLPVVFMTGYRDEERISGERWVLMKPFLTPALAKIMRDALERTGDTRGTVWSPIRKVS